MAMDGMEPLVQAPALSGRSDLGAAGLFLHAGWRSCGTWMWERLREHDGVRGFYEPLHEDLSTLRARDVGLLRPDSWKSGHGKGAPYFAEFTPLLRAGGKGVRGHERRFAFDRFFLRDEEDDRGLEAYLRGLMGSAAAEGRLPVMKFCRSLGRVRWLEARFPDVAHAVILRDPAAQWRSARRQMEQNKNRYFVLAPFIILARNADQPLLAAAMDRLAVKLPPRLGDGLDVTTDVCWRHVQKLSWQDRFRGFLALWVASSIAALEGQAALIDADALEGNAAHRALAEQTMAGAAGVPVDLMPDRPDDGGAGFFGTAAEQTDAAKARDAALRVLQDHGHRVSPARQAALAGKLAMPGSRTTGGAAGAVPAGPLDYVDAAAYVALARATYPLRRAHFHVRRWLGHV
jgi:hypothetical protein